MRALLVVWFLWPLAAWGQTTASPVTITVDGSHPAVVPLQSDSASGGVRMVPNGSEPTPHGDELAKYPQYPTTVTTDSGGIPVCGEVAGAPACPSPVKPVAGGRIDVIEGAGTECRDVKGAGKVCASTPQDESTRDRFAHGAMVATPGHIVADPEKWGALNKRLDVIEKELSRVQCTLDLTSRGPVAGDIIERFCAK